MHDGQAGPPVVFERLIAEAFRGFADEVDIDLAASVVIVRGPNGLGKTSLFDALQWALLGDIHRLREARVRQIDEYIVNSYRSDQQARVEVHLRLGEDRVVIVRTGDRSGSSLLWTSENETLRGAEAEATLARRFTGGSDLDLAASLNVSGLVQQDATRAVLSSRPRDRFDILSKMLGLGELEDTERWAKSLSDQSAVDARQAENQATEAERQVAAVANRLLAVRQLEISKPVVANVIQRLRTVVENERLDLRASISSREDAVELNAFATTVAREADGCAQDLRRLVIEGELLPPDGLDDLSQLALARDRAEARLAGSRDAHRAAQRDLSRLQAAQAILANMASVVMPHIEGPDCPVCGQTIDPVEVRSRLSELEGALSTVEAQRRVNESADSVAEAEIVLRAAADAQQAAADRSGRRQAWEQHLSRTNERLTYLWSLEGPLHFAATFPQSRDPDGLERLSASSSRVAALARELTSAWDAATSSEESRIAADEQQSKARLDAATSRREQLARAHTRAKNLYEAVRQARLEVVRREFARLGPLAQDIYSRLDPHPTFREIDLVSDLFRAAGTTTAQVSDKQVGVAANPMIVFSSAQASIAAISYLMALNLASSNGAPVLLLDDPLQAMDDVNVLGFADLCRHLRVQRQLFISTHEGRFAQLLERKLAPRLPEDRTIALEFVGWDRNGPSIKPRDVPDQVGNLGRVFVD